MAHPSHLVSVDSIHAAGAPSRSTPSLRSGRSGQALSSSVRRGGRHGPRSSSRRTGRIGPRFPPLPRTQGWGTLSCGDSGRTKKRGPPASCKERKDGAPTDEMVPKTARNVGHPPLFRQQVVPLVLTAKPRESSVGLRYRSAGQVVESGSSVEGSMRLLASPAFEVAARPNEFNELRPIACPDPLGVQV